MSSNKIQQAVILAGGIGSRLKPLTDNLPKPMISFHGKPFLEYLIDMLRKQGIKKILLLTGYLSAKISDYFKDGKRFGVDISYSVSPVENDTATRIKLAMDQIDEHFLLMYCDNYWPLRLNDMEKQFFQSKHLVQITVYNNKDHYTKNNVLVDESQSVTQYDKSRKATDLNGVDIGFVLMQKKALDLLPDGNVNFENDVYTKLIEQTALKAFQTDHRYYSVSSHERLSQTEEFLLFRPAICLDRDGVLNKRPEKGEYVKNWEEFSWLEGAKEAIALLNKEHYRVFVITNQPGIARKQMSEDDLTAIHDNMQKELAEVGAKISKIYYCPHGWDDGCDCRKPKPGLLYQAQKDFDLNLSIVPFIGDELRDQEAGQAAGTPSWTVSKDNTLLDQVQEFLFG